MPLDNPETPPLISRLCRDCRHWELRKTIRETPTGECRKSAPTPVFATRHRLQWLARLVRVAKLEWRGAWPLTHENDWCSEHAPKPARIRGWGDSDGDGDGSTGCGDDRLPDDVADAARKWLDGRKAG